MVATLFVRRQRQILMALALPAFGLTGVSTTAAQHVPIATSARQCMSKAYELIEDQRYARAGAWLKAAEQRATDRHTRRAARGLNDGLGLLGKPAPRLAVMTWLNSEPITPADLSGRVVLIDMFQFISDECAKSKPAVASLAGRYESKGLTVIGLAVAYQNQDFQRPERILRHVAENPFAHPVAIDANLTWTYRTYRAGGVPYTALIDRNGKLRWLGFFDASAVDRLIQKLLDENPTELPPDRRPTMPPSRGGHDLIGKSTAPWATRFWLNTLDGAPPDTDGRPHLIQFWTDNCRECPAAAAALDQLHADYARRGLAVIGVYHRPPPWVRVPVAELRKTVERFGLTCPIAHDVNGRILEALWLAGGRRDHTTATLLVDATGAVRFVHPGPHLYPSTRRGEEQQAEDYYTLRAAIEALLAEPASSPDRSP